MKRLFWLLTILAISSLAWGQAQSNPTGLQYQVPNYNPTTDTLTIQNMALGGNALQEGVGAYIWTGARDDNGCTEFFVSADGVQTPKPLFWPLAPSSAGNCDVTSIPSTRPLSSLFIAPWNDQYYLLSFDDWYTSPSWTFWIQTSSSLVSTSRWSTNATITIPYGSITNISNFGNWTTANSTGGAFWGGITMSPASMCPTQDYTCVHMMVVVFPNNTNAHAYGLELHPLNSSLTSWSNPQAVLQDDDTQLYYYNGGYLLFTKISGLSADTTWMTANCTGFNSSNEVPGDVYHAWTASSVSGTWTDNGDMCAYTPAYPGYTGSLPYDSIVENLQFVQADTGKWRIYTHDGNSDATGNGAAVSWWYQESTSPLTGSSWTTPVFTSMKDTQVTVASLLRTNDLKTEQIIAGAARQYSLPFNTNRGAGVCDGQQMRELNTGGPYAGDCYGMEHLSSTQSADGLEELRLFTSPSSRIHFGNYTGLTAWNDFGWFDANGVHTAACQKPFVPNITISPAQSATETALLFTVPSTPSMTITVPANCSGSTFAGIANATGSTTFTVKDGSTTICTGTVAASGDTISWSTGGSATNLTSGNTLSVVYSGDATLTGGLTLNACYQQ